MNTTNESSRGYCEHCGYVGDGLIPQHADPRTGLTCPHLTQYRKIQVLIPKAIGKLDALCDEYATWCKRIGVELGSADEHLTDERLTPSQRVWLRDFVERWDAAVSDES